MGQVQIPELSVQSQKIGQDVSATIINLIVRQNDMIDGAVLFEKANQIINSRTSYLVIGQVDGAERVLVLTV